MIINGDEEKNCFLVFFHHPRLCICNDRAYFSLLKCAAGKNMKRSCSASRNTNSQTIPFRRGDILDRKGTILATSTDVYNVVLDCTVVNAKKENVDPTVEALVKYLGLNETDIRTELKENPDSRYSVLAKRLPYSKVKDLEAVIEDDSSKNKVKGIWLERST